VIKDTFGPMLKRSLSDDLAQRIRQLIQSGGYSRGDRLPPIMEMARRFGVGHPTVREALKKLETIGVVEIRHGSGVYVARSEDVLVVAGPDLAGPVSKKLLLDLIEARIPIELHSVASAARNATDEHLAEMRRLLQVAGERLDDDDDLNAANMGFHGQIAVASGNAVLAQLLDVLQDLFRREQRLILDIYGCRQRDHAEHLEILAALEARNEPLAVERMNAHLEGVRAALLRWDPDDHPVG